MARTDTLGHFLTDVADAIREKGGTSESIQASQFDTAIENLPSGGGTVPTTVKELNDEMMAVRDTFNDYILALPSTYEADSSNALTLYTPDTNCPYYFIHKKSNGYYRVVWTGYANMIITTNQVQRMYWSPNSSYDDSSSSITSASVNYVPYVKAMNGGNQYYTSEDFATLALAIEKFKANQITYTASGAYNQAYTPDTTDMPIPYTNATFVDKRTNDWIWKLVPSKRLSSNETIETQSAE